MHLNFINGRETTQLNDLQFLILRFYLNMYQHFLVFFCYLRLKPYIMRLSLF